MCKSKAEKTCYYIENEAEISADHYGKGGSKIMKKPVLVIMAAGMGSRYGGLKQIDPIDPQGHIIMDFSLFDAKKQDLRK